VNKSDIGFTVEGGNVRFGLLAIKGVGDGPAGEIVRVRKEGGAFRSLADLCTRVDPKQVTKGTLETMIKAGAMDSLASGKRHQLLDALERAISWGKNQRAAVERGLVSLFGEMEETDSAFEFTLNPGAKELPRKQVLTWEKDLIGVYVSEHPLEYLNKVMKDWVKHNTAMITEESAKQKVVLGGTISEARRITTKKGDAMCIVKLEDMYGSISVTVFPRVYEQDPTLWAEDSVLIVNGEVQMRNDEPTIICESAELFQASEEELNRKEYRIWITIRVNGYDQRSLSDDKMRVQDAYNYIRNFPGRDRYDLLVVNGEWQTLLTPADNTTQYSPEFHQKLEEILGKGAVEAQIVE